MVRGRECLGLQMNFPQIARVAKIIAVISFLLPWVTVSCAGHPLGAATGFDLSVGVITLHDPSSGAAQTRSLGYNWLLIGSLFFITIGILFGFTDRTLRGKMKVGLVAALAALAFLFLGVQAARAAGQNLASSGGDSGPFAHAADGLFTVQTRYGFYLALLCWRFPPPPALSASIRKAEPRAFSSTYPRAPPAPSASDWPRPTMTWNSGTRCRQGTIRTFSRSISPDFPVAGFPRSRATSSRAPWKTRPWRRSLLHLRIGRPPMPPLNVRVAAPRWRKGLDSAPSAAPPLRSESPMPSNPREPLPRVEGGSR